MASSPILNVRVTNLKSYYDSTCALDIPDLAVSGNIICIIGHNGSGKSTFLKTALNLHDQHKGMISMTYTHKESSVALIPEKHLSFSPENGAIFSDISVEAYLRMWSEVKRRNRKYYLQEGMYYIEKLELTHLLKKLGRELSKGERRRVQTAAGFFCDPLCCLFDEPFDGLDIVQATNFAELLKSECHNRVFLISSHRLGIVERIASKLIVLSHGRVIANGTTEEACITLAKRSITITLPEAFVPSLDSILEEFETRLKTQFTELCSIAKYGNAIVVTGQEVAIENLKNLWSTMGITGIPLIGEPIMSESTPSLTEAMTYHLINSKSQR